MEDNIAVSRIKQGDLNGLEILVRRYQVQAVHASYLILFDKTGAEDIVQKAFVKVVEHIHKYDENRPFAPWFLRIVVNDSLKLAEKQGRSISLDEVLDQRNAQLTRWLTDPEPGPELRLEQQEMRQDILNAVRSLPPGQRAAIVMRYFLDLSMAETSTKMGRPLSTIKWWLRDGRRRLRELVDIPEVDRS